MKTRIGIEVLNVQSTYTEPQQNYDIMRGRAARGNRLAGKVAIFGLAACTLAACSPPSPSATQDTLPPPISESFAPIEPPSVSPHEDMTQRAHAATWSCAILGLPPIEYPSATQLLSFAGTTGFEYPGNAAGICDNSQDKPLPPQFSLGTCLSDGMLTSWPECTSPLWICGSGGSQSMGVECWPYETTLASPGTEAN